MTFDPSRSVLFRGATLIDPAAGREQEDDLLVLDGIISRLSETPPGLREYDARGLHVAPAFIDLHAHFREPGGEAAETVATGSRAFAAGGFTAAVSMPNTRPPVDSPAAVRRIRELSSAAGLIDILPAAALTPARSGEQPADYTALAQAGAVAFTDDGTTPSDPEVMEAACRAVARTGGLVMDHAQDPKLEAGGVMHEGERSRELGLPGISASAETDIVERDIAIARMTGCRLHIQHVSAAASVDLIRAAKKEGLPVTAEATPHHLAFCDRDIDPGNTNFKVNPPLRSARDREALLAGVRDGTLDVFATDHAPHTAEAKARGFIDAPFGMVGAETAAGATFTTTVLAGILSPLEWVRRWTTAPAAILGRPAPSLAPGARADLVCLDLDHEWVVDPERFHSKSRNSPFCGKTLTGRAAATLFRGRFTP
ncbi:dihydroorotase [Kiritimatiella glycovorans]|uniref:Dihydroorotase n=1 Tax=Kiritimatiella glycovorans TaxID=1307763 RepID=A0A0G3E9X6_9BACT|nr:dihydroorotase [Kiritimatiella glycovorans]AKJ63296.1 Dihydroorotase [Kiritimatiella glycovorans]